MGHNLTERRARELQAAAHGRVVSGWVVGKDGRVDQPQTPAAVLARGSTLTGRCGKRLDCGRRVVFDPALWCERGHGVTPLAQVLDTYRCGLLPCPLHWSGETYPAGLPLGSYLADAGCKVVVACPCGELKPRRFTIRRFAELVRHGAGPQALALPAANLPSSVIRGACPWCRERRWSIRVLPTPPEPRL